MNGGSGKADEVPEEAKEEVENSIGYSGGWRALKVAGPLDFELVGVLSDLAGPLARDGVPIFAVSTFDTDYLLVREERLQQAKQTLVDEGHELL